MSAGPYIDHYLYEYRPTPSRSDYTVKSNYSSDHEIRRQVQVLGDQHAYHTDVWYPGLESYVTTETETCANHLPHHASLPDYSLPNVLVTGKRKTSEDDAQYIQPTACAKVDVATSELRGNECDPLMEVYELPADTDYVVALEVGTSLSESHPPVLFRA
jgi:hypothetical protein